MTGHYDTSKTCFVFPDGERPGGFFLTMMQPTGRALRFALDWKAVAQLQKQLADAMGQMEPPPEKYFQK